jgi:hypothetical protein
VAQTALYYVQEHLIASSSSKKNATASLDFVLFCQVDWMVDLSKWFPLVQAQQSSPHDLLIGDLRDKTQKPREFPVGNESHWYYHYENVHLYLGSECLAISTKLLPGILDQSRNNPDARAMLEGNLGHDIACLAYFIPRTLLHWVPIVKSHRFWEAMA